MLQVFLSTKKVKLPLQYFSMTKLVTLSVQPMPTGNKEYVTTVQVAENVSLSPPKYNIFE